LRVLAAVSLRRIKLYGMLHRYRECIGRRAFRKPFADLLRAQGDPASSIARAISSHSCVDPRKKRLIGATGSTDSIRALSLITTRSPIL
jgi:hypothetical protein